VRVAGEFARHVHQNVGGLIAGIGIEHEVEFDSMLVTYDRDIIALGPAQQLEPQHPIKGQSAV
jgi:hypothetical protein